MNNLSILHFKLAWKSYCTTPASALALVLAAAAVLAKCSSFYVKVFNVMGKALSGKLLCPCDRSC